MTALYNFLDANGNITNDPYGKTADGGWDMSQQNKWQGLAGAQNMPQLGMAANGGPTANYITQDIPTPMPMPGATGLNQSGGMAPGGINPYGQQMGQDLSDQMLKAFNRTTLPAISSRAAGAGDYGSSRQGVLEANAMNDFSQNQGAALNNLYGNMYGQGLNYDIGLRNNQLGYANNASQNAANSNSYDLGLRNNDLAYAGLDRQINNDNNSWMLQGAQLGLQGNQALQQGNTIGQQVGSTIQNAPLNYWNQFSNVANGFGQGYSTNTQGMQTQGSPVAGALGGAQLGSSLWNQFGGGNSAPSTGNSFFGGSGGLGGFDNSSAGFGAAF